VGEIISESVGEIISESVGGIIPERRAASPGIGTQEAPVYGHFCGVNLGKNRDWLLDTVGSPGDLPSLEEARLCGS
jgi:hypothetical protein